VFRADGSARDLETIYQFGNSASAGSNVMLREWLTDWRLWLYFAERSWAESFEEPVFPLTLGRQQELAHVEPGADGVTVQEVNLTQAPTILRGTAVPFPSLEAGGFVMALPLVMTPDLPRRAIGVRPWLLLREPVRTQSPELWHDGELGQGVYFVGGGEA
jgi:CRISPR-associated protein Cas5t